MEKCTQSHKWTLVLQNSRIQSSKAQFYPGWTHQKCRIPLISQPRRSNPVCIFSTAFPESEVARSGLAVTLSNGWFCAARLELSSLRPWTEPLSKQKIPVIALVLSNCEHHATPTPSSPASSLIYCLDMLGFIFFLLQVCRWHVQHQISLTSILALIYSPLSHWSVRLGYKASHVLSRVHVWSWYRPFPEGSWPSQLIKGFSVTVIIPSGSPAVLWAPALGGWLPQWTAEADRHK